jgi:O-Antigen ligase
MEPTANALPRRPSATSAGSVALRVAVLVALALVVGAQLARVEAPPPTLIAVGGLALLAVLALAVASLEAAVVVGVALTAAVKVEPAPADLVLGVAMLVALLTGRFDLGRVPVAFAGLVGALLVLNAVSVLAAVDVPEALLFMATTAYLGLVALWLVTFVNSQRRARAVLLAYVGAAVVAALFATLALVAPIPGRTTLLYDGCCRAEGLFKDPNVFGPFLVPAVALLLQELLAPLLLPGRRALKAVALSVLVVGILVSYSRAAWLNLVVAIIVLLAVLGLRPRGARTAAALLGVVALLGVAGGTYLAASGSEAFLKDRAAYQGYDTERFATQRAGIRLAEANPVGVGPGQFDVHEPISAHSTYVRVLAEQGTLGFVVLVALFLATLAVAADNAASGRSTWGIGSAALLAAWCGLLANSFFIDSLHWRYLWLVAALIWAGAARRPYASSRGP